MNRKQSQLLTWVSEGFHQDQEAPNQCRWPGDGPLTPPCCRKALPDLTQPPRGFASQGEGVVGSSARSAKHHAELDLLLSTAKQTCPWRGKAHHHFGVANRPQGAEHGSDGTNGEPAAHGHCRLVL